MYRKIGFWRPNWGRAARLMSRCAKQLADYGQQILCVDRLPRPDKQLPHRSISRCGDRGLHFHGLDR